MNIISFFYLVSLLYLSKGLKIERGRYDKILSNNTNCTVYNAAQDGRFCNCTAGSDTFLSLDEKQYQCQNDKTYGMHVLIILFDQTVQ